MLKHKRWFWIGAMLAALAFDFLFWKKPFGISFFIWTVVLLARRLPAGVAGTKKTGKAQLGVEPADHRIRLRTRLAHGTLHAPDQRGAGDNGHAVTDRHVLKWSLAVLPHR